MDRGEQSSLHKLLQTLQQSRGVILSDNDEQELADTAGYLKQSSVLASILKQDHPRECSALSDVIAICSQPPELGGLGLTKSVTTNGDQESEILFLVSAWLEALNSADRAKSPPVPLSLRPPGRRGMTLSEKIFAFHDIDRKGSVAPGELIRVDVDWVIASEASWSGMERTYNMLGKPGIFRNDRFWLAGDHVVDPRVNKTPKVQALIDAIERARRVFKMTDYQGMNYTILHTEFYREHAQPGMQLKRNTVAADRIVEFSGPGAKHLSCDARFAICNMTTEIGGITGVFLPDEITEDFIQRRHLLRHKNAGVYFQPDEDAVYAETHTIDLGNVRSFIAKYPNPDDVVPVTDEEAMDLDGCFIGACTTAEEDLILGALVLEQGLKNGLKPIPRGKRKVVPG
ncbi:hypothetical protein DTO271G3_8564 [Paecilomyces variotii]|nr:hypothetical protein DTO271G3_8564 [Paecilomyces variotii]